MLGSRQADPAARGFRDRLPGCVASEHSLTKRRPRRVTRDPVAPPQSRRASARPPSQPPPLPETSCEATGLVACCPPCLFPGFGSPGRAARRPCSHSWKGGGTEPTTDPGPRPAPTAGTGGQPKAAFEGAAPGMSASDAIFRKMARWLPCEGKPASGTRRDGVGPGTQAVAAENRARVLDEQPEGRTAKVRTALSRCQKARATPPSVDTHDLWVVALGG